MIQKCQCFSLKEIALISTMITGNEKQGYLLIDLYFPMDSTYHHFMCNNLKHTKTDSRATGRINYPVNRM